MPNAHAEKASEAAGAAATTRDVPPASTPHVPPRPKPLLRGWSHLVGALVTASVGPSLAGSAGAGSARWLTAVYVVAITAMLGASALYHVPHWSPRARRALKRVDHSASFVGVAGTYTPIAGHALGGAGGIALLITVWTGALGGIVLANWRLDAPKWLRSLPYVVLGWIAVLAVPGLWSAVGAGSVALLVAGGALYTVGAAVYAARRPDPWPRVFGSHEVFHALVLAAVACHWAVIARAVG